MSTIKIRIREAQPRDVVAIYDLLVHSLKEVDYDVPAPDEGAAITWISGVLIQKATWVADMDGEIIGALGLEASPWPWNPQFLFATNAFFYVRSDRRAGGTALKLKEAAQKRMKGVGMHLILGIMWGGASELKDKLIARGGGEYIGGNVLFPAENFDGQHIQGQDEDAGEQPADGAS